MPSYITHSVHGNKLFKSIDKKIELDINDFETYCAGPDLLIASDYKTFDLQHSNNVKEYFMYLIKYIKEEKLYNDEETMSFLYGQIDHYILDLVMHPLIYSYTKFKRSDFKIDLHGLMEMWLDDYILKIYDIKRDKFYSKKSINSSKLKKLMNDTYHKIYHTNMASLKYLFGIRVISLFDYFIRDKHVDVSLYMDRLGNILHEDHEKELLPYLNLEHDKWINPETGEVSKKSLMDLWEESKNASLQTIEDVNKYIYDNKYLNNGFINNDISYNTGLPCNYGQEFKYLKKRK